MLVNHRQAVSSDNGDTRHCRYLYLEQRTGCSRNPVGQATPVEGNGQTIFQVGTLLQTDENSDNVQWLHCECLRNGIGHEVLVIDPLL